LKAFFQWAKKKKLVSEDPLEDVLPRKIKKTENPSRKPFSEEEIIKVSSAFKNDTYSTSSNDKHFPYYPFVYFIFKTGVRNAEAVGLRVRHIDLNKCTIRIEES
jgi:integrase